MIIKYCSSGENIDTMKAMPNCVEHCMVGASTLAFLLPGLAYAFCAKSPHLGIMLMLLALGMTVSAEQDINSYAEETYNQTNLDEHQVEETGKVFYTQEQI